jgi:hypothetical protein
MKCENLVSSLCFHMGQLACTATLRDHFFTPPFHELVDLLERNVSALEPPP